MLMRIKIHIISRGSLVPCNLNHRATGGRNLVCLILLTLVKRPKGWRVPGWFTNNYPSVRGEGVLIGLLIITLEYRGDGGTWLVYLY